MQLTTRARIGNGERECQKKKKDNQKGKVKRIKARNS